MVRPSLLTTLCFVGPLKCIAPVMCHARLAREIVGALQPIVGQPMRVATWCADGNPLMCKHREQFAQNASRHEAPFAPALFMFVCQFFLCESLCLGRCCTLNWPLLFIMETQGRARCRRCAFATSSSSPRKRHSSSAAMRSTGCTRSTTHGNMIRRQLESQLTTKHTWPRCVSCRIPCGRK